MIKPLETKDPDEKKDYMVRWRKQLTPFGDTIASSSWTVPDGIVKFDESFNDSEAVVWLEGGTLGGKYELVNRIVTNSTPPRVLDQTITIRVRRR
jgi:hypothetical protein